MENKKSIGIKQDIPNQVKESKKRLNKFANKDKQINENFDKEYHAFKLYKKMDNMNKIQYIRDCNEAVKKNRCRTEV